MPKENFARMALTERPKRRFWNAWVPTILLTLFLVGVPAMAMGVPLASGHTGAVVYGGALGQGRITHSCTGGTTTPVESENWAGYAVETCLSSPASGAVTFVHGSWVEPALKCGSTDTYAAFWVGIDGYSSGTVEQTGTLAECMGGVAHYSAWYEMYPKYPVTFPLSISPGNRLAGTVSYSGGVFTITLKDVTTGAHSTVKIRDTQDARSSAEWIAEAPYDNGILPLADFGTVTFQDCRATLLGVNGPINDLSWQNARIDMVNSAGSLKASTGPLSSTGESFTITWVASN
jgi:hypothetical protein